jgi:hypothetical protein
VWLNKTGWYAWLTPNGGLYDQATGSYRKRAGFNINGMQDAIAISPTGVVLFLEFKAERGVQSQAQKNFENQIKKRHGHYVLVRSLEGLKWALEKLTVNV